MTADRPLPGGPSLGSLLAGFERVLLVRAPWVRPGAVPEMETLPGVVAVDLTRLGAPSAEETPDALLLVVRDVAALRQVAGACRRLPASTRVGCVLLEGTRPPLTAGRPDWPALTSLTARTSPLCFSLAELERPLAAGSVIADLARRSSPRHLMAGGRPVLGLDQGSPSLWPPGDALSVVGPAAEVVDTGVDYPPDLVVVDAASLLGDAVRTGDHPVLGPLTTAVRVASSATWAEVDADAAGTPADLGALDGAVLNPMGFARAASEPVGELRPEPTDAALCRVDTEAGPVVVDTRSGPGPRELAGLRALAGVHVGWRGATGPRDYCRTVVGLAMAGVPLTCAPAPGWARDLIDDDVLRVLTSSPDIDDPLVREVHSIRLRRAAHAAHGAQAWRDGLAAAHGLQRTPAPHVSVLLPTRRPELLGFAMRQVRRQRGVDLELVLATHGHQPDPAVLDDVRRTATFPVTVVAADADTSFGDLLNVAAARAQGDVLLKMDDDDWYGPDFVSDLLLARSYSGADVVGTPPEFVYLEQLGITVHRKDVSERFHTVVAGGTLMVSREAYVAVGGFRRMRRYVDAGLLQAVSAAGGSIYRTHGHGYLLRRGSGGHTWDPGLGYFVRRSRTTEQWLGFRPSPLLEPDDLDRPGTVARSDA